MSDLLEKITSPERALVLPQVFDSDKYEALSIQLETVRLSGFCTADLIKTMLNTVRELSEDTKTKQTNSVALTCKRIIPTERSPLVGEVSANFC
jgi:hypothetical protein